MENNIPCTNNSSLDTQQINNDGVKALSKALGDNESVEYSL